MKKEVQYLIKHFYRIQEHRMAFASQIRALQKAKLPTNPLDGYLEDLWTMEKKIGSDLTKSVKQEPLWNYLKKVKGIGPIIAASLINLIDFKKAKHVSSLWKYAGLDVVEGEGRTRKKKHLVPKTYINKKGKKIRTKGISFNPLLKTLCVYKISRGFLTSGSPYAKLYYERRKYEQKKHPDLSKGHIHNRARRYMIKRFLLDLWVEGRKLEGLPVSKPYVIAELKHQER